MAKSSTNNNQEPKKDNAKFSPKIPVFGFLLKLLTKVIGVSIFAGMVLLLLELGLFMYVDEPLQASYERYQSVSNFAQTGSWFNEESVMTMVEVYLLGAVNLDGMIAFVDKYAVLASSKLEQSSSGKTEMSRLMISFSKDVISAIPELIRLWVIVTFTWLAKILTVIAMILPCLVIIGAGFVDGTVERKINTFKGKRDSQDTIEWWYLAFTASSYTVLFFYMAIPNSLQATHVMLPSACLSAFFVRQVTASYKKYW